MSGIPWPTTPWDEIIPGLFMGGHNMVDSNREGKFSMIRERSVVVDKEFDLVISLYEDGYVHGPHPDVEHIEHLFNDDHLRALDSVTKTRLHELAMYASLALDAGKKVLVRCQAGYNRSGLLVGLILMRAGLSAAEAIELVREKRSNFALQNDQFVLYLYSQQRVPGASRSSKADTMSPWDGTARTT